MKMTASASAADSDELSSSSPPPSASTATVEEPIIPPREEKLDMPWSEVQEWALMDNLPKFTVTIPPPITGGKPKRYAMWRTLMREVPELAGYPISFLLQMHQRSLQNEKSSSKSSNTTSSAMLETPGVLPMVDDFEFVSNGGIVGRAYGLPGIADGTKIQTPSLFVGELLNSRIFFIITCE